MISKPINYHETMIVNTNNYKDKQPFENKTVTDNVWFDSLDPITKKEMIDFCQSDAKDSLYRFWFNNFSYEKWYTDTILNGPKATIITLDNKQKDLLKTITHNRILRTDPDLRDDELDDLMKHIPLEIDNKSSYFVRLSSCSAKHDFPLYPIEGKIAIFDYLTKSLTFYRTEYNREKITSIIILPWNNFSKRYEFRVFINRKKITGVSQQYFWKDYNYTDSELEKLISIFTSVDTKQTLINDIRYNSYVADVYIDMDNLSLHLIECNPYGSFSSSGSSLFEWIEDSEVLEGERTAELRYKMNF